MSSSAEITLHCHFVVSHGDVEQRVRMGVGANPEVQDVCVISRMLWEASSISAKTQSQKEIGTVVPLLSVNFPAQLF